MHAASCVVLVMRLLGFCFIIPLISFLSARRSPGLRCSCARYQTMPVHWYSLVVVLICPTATGLPSAHSTTLQEATRYAYNSLDNIVCCVYTMNNKNYYLVRVASYISGSLQKRSKETYSATLQIRMNTLLLMSTMFLMTKFHEVYSYSIG